MITTSCSEFRAKGLATLSGKWTESVIFVLVYLVITTACSFIPVIGSFSTLLLVPLAYATVYTFLKQQRGGIVSLGDMAIGWNGRVYGTLILMYVYTFLWTLLLFIPGIIKGYSYSMTSYVMVDNPELEYNAAIERSMAMMDGYKMKLFLLDLSFIGWALLSILTLGIGLLWLIPYMQQTNAAFYEELKADWEARQA